MIEKRIELLEPHSLQKQILLDPHRFRVLSCGRRWGKALSLTTPILTESGWIYMDGIQVGDRVFDNYGNLVNVIGISEVFNDRECYCLEFSNGEEIIADAEHEWVVEDKNFRKSLGRAKDITKLRKNKSKTLTTIELRDKLKCGKETNFSIPITKPIKFSKKDYILPPYVLGLWLGDGTSRCGDITTNDPEIIDFIKEYGFLPKQKSKYTWAIYTKEKHTEQFHKGKDKTIASLLKELKVLDNKYIPKEYLLGSIEDRILLLQGLMDTDGTIDPDGYCEFTSCCKPLAYDTHFLLTSLGIKATINEYDAKLYGRIVNTKCRIHFTAGDIDVFRLSRKLNRISKKHKSDINRIFIKRIYSVDNRPTKCIEVDSPDHIYLAGKYLIPTHNSVLAMRGIFEMIYEGWIRTKEKQRGWIVAPTFPLVREDWMLAETILKDAITRKHLTEMKMDLDPFGFIEFKSAERDDEGLRGAGLNCCVVDEASRVSRKSWEQGLRPALSDKLGKCIFISTPKGRNWFYELYVKGQSPNDEIKSWQHPTFSNPFFPQSEWSTLVETTPEMILRQEYYADFLEDDATVFKNLSKCLRGSLEIGSLKEKYSIGIDLGKSEDFTVITVMKESNASLVHIYRVNKVDWSLQKAQIKAICKMYANALVYVDSTGLGDPIEEDLRQSGINTRGIKFSNTSKQVLVERLIVAIEQGLISIPDCKETKFLIDELMAFSYEILNSGKMRYEAPEGLHDDGVISLALALSGMSYALYRKEQEKKNNLPHNSPAELERRCYESEMKRRQHLPRRFQKNLEHQLSLS